CGRRGEPASDRTPLGSPALPVRDQAHRDMDVSEYTEPPHVLPRARPRPEAHQPLSRRGVRRPATAGTGARGRIHRHHHVRRPARTAPGGASRADRRADRGSGIGDLAGRARAVRGRRPDRRLPGDRHGPRHEPRPRGGRLVIGRFALVLHSHLPWLKGHGRWPVGEEWLNQAIASSYIPVVDVLRRLGERGGRNLVTVGVTPVLAAQLDDPYCLDAARGWVADWLWRTQELAPEDPVAARREARSARAALAALEGRYRAGFSP